MNRPILLLALLGASAAARAHFLWATLDPVARTVSLGLQELPSEAPLPLAARAANVKAWPRGGSPLSLTPDGAWLKATTRADAVGASLDYGVLDRSAEGRGRFWLRYYAKAAATSAASQKRVGLPVELSATPGKDGTMITVLKGGKPAEGAEVVVAGADGKAAFEGKASDLGTVVLPRMSAPLAVRALVTEDLKGEGYDSVRSYSTLNIGVRPAPLPLSRALRAAFGKDHDVVSHTAFIQTVMGGKLTRAQLEIHLQQRALVHEALHRVLNGAADVPYGVEQRDVLKLILADLIDMGSAPPADAQARPVTRAFIREIEASAKRGPYFALGVFHVYYGGITNGGRDVGAMIGDQVGYTPAYYEKSDGYRPYLTGVDRIVDSQAREETIRGGRAAYRFIIATNDEGVYQTR